MCGVICMILCLAILIHYLSVTDRQTHRHTTTAYSTLSKASRGKNTIARRSSKREECISSLLYGKIARVCCDRLLVAHSPNLSNSLLWLLVTKYFWWGCFVPPSVCPVACHGREGVESSECTHCLPVSGLDTVWCRGLSLPRDRTEPHSIHSSLLGWLSTFLKNSHIRFLVVSTLYK